MRERSLPRLDQAYLDAIAEGTQPAPSGVRLPCDAKAFPERVVQFGTGAFLRGFVEYFVDEANRRGSFGARIVAVGSTGAGRDRILDEQDGLYTLSSRGVVNGAMHEEHRIVSSLSRALSAQRDWAEVLACARAPELELVFSNTTEVGIVLDESDTFDASPPKSFPGKLTRFLYERGSAFAFAPDRGVIVLPCELIENNGNTLRGVVRLLAKRWQLSPEFLTWLDRAVTFCNTLVDRIVPGAPTSTDADAMRRQFGYDDAMMTTCEPYRLFAIEGDEALRARLPFARADVGVVITRDIGPYRERKVRLLNGAHTIMVSVALLCGCDTVQQAMEHPLVGRFVRRAIFSEILETVSAPDAEEFARDVLDRFANPFMRHALFDITLQGTMKMRVRVVPSILRFAEQTGHVPTSLAFGFAAFLNFMRGELQERRRNDGLPVPADDQAQRLRDLWFDRADGDDAAFATRVCADEQLWGADLSTIPGFTEAVAVHLTRMRCAGVESALESHLTSTAGSVSTTEPGLSLRTT